MNQINIQSFKTLYGELILGSYLNKLCICDWKFRKQRDLIDSRIQKGLQAEFIESDSEIISETEKQLSEYFQKERKEFTVPLLFIGTEFQKLVWNSLLEIPYGQTDTYLGLSIKLKNEKAIRAIASANGANAISIIVPCHRIIGSDGDLVGYAGGLPTKQKLLNLEGSKIDNQMPLFIHN